MDVQTNIGHVIKVLARNKPDDLADLAFGIMVGHACKGVRVNLFPFREVRRIVQRCALCIGEERVRVVLVQCIKLGLIHRRFDCERPSDIDAEKADVDASHLMSDE